LKIGEKRLGLEIIYQLLEDGIIDKEQLVLKRHKYIGLKKQEAIFIAKLFKNKEIKEHTFSISKLANILNLSEESIQVLIRTLIASNCLKVINKDKQITFDFNYTIVKLLETY